MRKFTIAAMVVAGLFVIGCKSNTIAVGPDGSKVTQDAAGNMRIDDGKGTVVDIDKGADGSMTMKNNKGAEVTYTDKGASGVTEKGEKFSIGAAEVSESEMGLSYYPGSQSISGDSKMESAGKKVFVSMRTTSDDPEKVINFYKPNVKEPQTMAAGEIASLGGKLDDGRQVSISAIRSSDKTQITITVTDK